MTFGRERGCNRLSAVGLSSLLLVLIVGVCTISSLVFSSPLLDTEEGGIRAGDESAAMVGGAMVGAPNDVDIAENSVEMEDIGKFAVQEHNTKEGKNLTFRRVVSAKTQVVAGTMYHLILEAIHPDLEQPKVYEAKVWTKPWENHKSLEHFKESETSSSISSDTREASGLYAVSVDDPVIKEAAEHALKGLNNMSNSLVPYTLKEIISAHSEAGDKNKLQLKFKVSKGPKEEDVQAGVHRTSEGKWTVTSAPKLQ